jgi:hypothetical protein
MATINAVNNGLSGATGSGSFVGSTSPTLVTPVLGTPSSGTLTSCTGLPIGTGVSNLGTGVATFLTTPSSANFASALTDELGTGKVLFGSAWATDTPVVTLVGGAGNVVPQYVTAQTRYSVNGKTCFIDMFLNGDGGNEGAGTGRINLSLPAGITLANGINYMFCCGYYNNGATFDTLGVDFGASTTTLSLIQGTTGINDFAGADQNNATRTIRLHLFFEIA